MAMIRAFKHRPDVSPRFQSQVDCGWVVGDFGGKRILRLETYGSDTRQIPGKKSQTVELDEQAARELLDIIRRAFPGI